MKVDAHQHYWLFDEAEFGWLEGPYQSLRRDFTPPDALPEMESMGYSHCVAVQARESLEENTFLLDLADRFPQIAGAVGWVDLKSSQCEQQLESIGGHPKMKGVRLISQGQPKGYFSDPAFLAGIRLLPKFDLVYDVLIYSTQLAEATELVSKFPDQSFVLDHAAKPPILAGDHGAWTRHIRELAKRENVSCKLSGLVTEADLQRWTPDSLKHYAQAILEAFGPKRLMIGSDWPVCLAAGEYETVMSAQEFLIEHLSADEKSRVLGETAEKVYKLAR